jgi:hypothetical protein
VQVLQALLVQQELQAHRAQQELQVFKVKQDHAVCKGFKVFKVKQVPPDLRV